VLPQAEELAEAARGEARADRRPVSEIAEMVDDTDTRVLARQVVGNRRGPVGRPVVDNNDLVPVADRAEEADGLRDRIMTAVVDSSR